MTTPPAYLLVDFDPRSAKVAELRGILLAHDVPYASNAKKSDLVNAYEKSIRPQAARLLADMQAVRASDHGVLDGESQGSSLRELDTDYEQEPEADEPAPARKRVKSRSTAADSAARKGNPKSKSSKGKGKAREGDERLDESSAIEDESAQSGMEDPTPRKSKKRSRARKGVVDEDVTMDIDEPEEAAYEAPAEYEMPLRDDYDTEEDEAPRVSPKKRKADDSGGPLTPRLSEITGAARKGRLSLGTVGGDGNFSDYNPFQSGGEETPQRDSKRRKSSLGPSRHAEAAAEESASAARLKSRKSMPALPSQRAGHTAGSWSSPKKAISPVKPRQSAPIAAPAPAPEAEHLPYEDDVYEPAPMPTPSPPKAATASPRKPAGDRASLGSGIPVGVQYMVPKSKVKTTPPQFAELLLQREAEKIGRVVGPPARGRRSSSPQEARGRRTGASSSSPEVVPARAIALREEKRSAVSWSAVVRALRALFFAFAVAYVLWWREEKLAAGFCDTGSDSNALIASRRTSLAAPLPDLPDSVTSLADRLHVRPSCTACPQHGHCSGGNFVGCTLDYVPRQSPLRLGGLLPIAPRCVPDTEKLMMVAMQASKASRLLRQRRGEVICKGLEKMRRKESDQEARVFGLQAEAVLAALRSDNERAGRPFDEDVLEEVNRLALRDLESHGEVLVLQNGDEYWFASQTAEMPMSCRLRLATIRSLKRHKARLASLLAVFAALMWARRKLRARRNDAELVRQLVQVALRQLQQQERSHYTDPVHVPFPHVVPSHLRDLILQDEHSPSRRAALWKQVEKIVEGNANVRVADVEQYGEEMRGWLWTGPTSRIDAPPAAEEYEAKPQMAEGGRLYPSLIQSPARA